MWGRHHHLVFTVCNYSMCTADVIPRSAYIIHGCCLAEITEHFFPSHQTYQIPCTLFSSLIIFKLHRDHVVQRSCQSIEIKHTLPKMNLGDIKRYSSASDMFKPTTGTDSVDPAKLDPANCGRGGKKVSFVLLREFTNKESLWSFWVKN